LTLYIAYATLSSTSQYNLSKHRRSIDQISLSNDG
jgi:hypothetical protein